MIKSTRIDLYRIGRLHDKCISNIINFYNADKQGWHQFANSVKVGNVATAQALITLDDFKVEFSGKEPALLQLINKQIASSDEAYDGGWTYVTNVNNFPTTNPTCWSLLMLLKDPVKYQIEIEKGLNWLIKNKCYVLSSHTGWGMTKTSTPNVYSTCLAMSVLAKCGRSDNIEFQQALSWLMSIRNSENHGWGKDGSSKSSLFYTAIVLQMLLDQNITFASFSESFNYVYLGLKKIRLVSNAKLPVHMEHYSVFHPIDPNSESLRLTYVHFELCYVISLIIAHKGIKDKLVFDWMNNILDNCNNGYLEYFEDNDHKITLWSIYDILFTLKRFNLYVIEDRKRYIYLRNKTLHYTDSTLSVVSIMSLVSDNKSSSFCILLIVVIIFLALFRVLTLETACWSIIIPLIISVVANKLTK